MSTTTDDSVPFSPVPFSPFSDSVTVSEPTSDENPDLGQFNYVFRTLTHLQPHPWIPAFNGLYPTPTVTSLSSATERGLAIVRVDDGDQQERGSRTAGEDEGETTMQTASEVQHGSTVWHQQQIMSYLDYPTTDTHAGSPSELIVAQFRHYPYGPMQELDRMVQSVHGEQAMDQVASETEEEEGDDDDDDTESGMTVDISSNGSGDDLEFESGDDEDEEEMGAVVDTRPNGDSPSLWQSVMRVPLCPYSPQWDSEDLENADEFGPFDAATTASSGTRPTEHSETAFSHQVYHRQVASPLSSLRDGAGSIITSRTSPLPVESMRSSSASLPSFPAHDDNTYYSDTLSLPERPSSLPVAVGHRAHHHHQIFSSPLNDNSTRSSISIASYSSFSSTSSPPPSQPPWRQSRQSPPSHARHINTTQPQLRLFNPTQQERSSGSVSTVTTSDSTLTRRAGARSLQSIFKEEDTISRATSQGNGPTAVAGEQQAVHDGHASDSDSQQQQEQQQSTTSPEDIYNRHTSSPSLSIVSDHHTDSSFDQNQAPEPLSLHSTVMNAARELYYNIPTLGGEGVERFEEEEPLPSLGLLDEALRFIAEERARCEALRETGVSVMGGLSSDSERWKHELESSDSAHTAPSMTRSTSNSATSASDLMLLPSPEHPKHTPRKKKKQKKTPVTSPITIKEKKSPSKHGVSGNVTPVMAMSILRPDGTIIGGGMANRTKRRSTGSDSYLGSGTLTPRVGGSGLWSVQGESTEPDAEDLAGVDVTPKKKKNRKGKEKDEKSILSHSRSVPEMKHEDDEEIFGPRVSAAKKGGKYPSLNIAKAQSHAVNTKRARLQGLARQLQELYPEDKRCLDRVLKSLASQKRKEKGKGGRAKVLESSEEEHVGRMRGELDGDREDEELDPRGRPPRKGDPLIHVFIDHSNILFGLLSYLKRHPPKRPLPPTPSSTTSSASTFKPRHKSASSVSSAPSSPTDAVGGSIPLPSFATARNTKALVRINERENSNMEEHENGSNSKSTGTNGTNQRHMRYLSHSALTLILERGRPVTRRVLVTSSPLYQPVDGMERLGYQVSIFLRVPDLGDGMDRDRPNKSLKRNSGSGYGSGSGSGPGIPIPNKRATHARQVSGSNGSASDFLSVPGSKGTVSAPSSYASPAGLHLHSAMLARSSAGFSNNGNNHNAAGSGGGTPHRIRFREQGVDELLQLKLHQALAAEDDVPAGATIVLATGDGNVGQFNEEGFLGPVRTALKRGWRVELYSWESGLSRAWKREFGRDSEWGKSGMFRIYGMEQFASSLVEDGWVDV